MYDISQENLLKKAKEKYGEDISVSHPYFVDDSIVRVGILINKGNIAFGANFFYKEQLFR